MVAPSKAELAQRLKQLRETRQVNEVRIESVKTLDPDHDGMVPIEVAGMVVTARENGGGKPVSEPFVVSYLLGLELKSGNPAVAALAVRNPAKPLEEPASGGSASATRTAGEVKTGNAEPGNVKR
jgi:hypothetical protein